MLRRLFLLTAALWGFSAPALAQSSSVSGLTASGPIVGTQLTYCPIAGSSSLKCTFTQVDTFINAQFSGDCTAASGGLLTCLSTNGTAFGPLATLTSPVPVNKGGTGTTTPSLVAGSGVTVSGTWPNQTITASGGGTLTVTDGTNTVSAATQVTFNGGSVSGTTPNASVTISGGAGLTNFATHSALISATTAFITNTLVQQGFYAVGDGGAATYDWNASSYCPNGTHGSPTTADGLMCILPSGQSASTAGRYLLQVPGGQLDVRMIGFHDDGTDNASLVNALMTAIGPPSNDGGSYDIVFPAAKSQQYVTYYFSNEAVLSRNDTYKCTGNTYSNGAELVFAAGVDGLIQEDQAYTSDHGYGSGTVSNCTIVSLGYGTAKTAASGFTSVNTVSMYSDLGGQLPVSTWSPGDGIMIFPQAGGSFASTDIFVVSPGAYISGVSGSTLTLGSGYTTDSALPASTTLAIYQLPVSLKFSVTTTSGSNAVTVTGGPRLLVPGDMVWSDAFPFGSTVLTVSGSLGSQTAHMTNMFMDATAENATVTHTSGSGQMWVVPAGLKRDVVAQSDQNYITQFPIALQMSCNSAGGLNCTGSHDSNNTFQHDGIGRMTAGDNTSGSSSINEFGGKNFITDFFNGALLGEVDTNFLSESQENNTAYASILGNCLNDNFSLMSGGYQANVDAIGGCATGSGMLPITSGSPWMFVGSQAYLPAGAPSIGAIPSTGQLTGSWQDLSAGTGTQCGTIRNEATGVWFGLSNSHCSTTSTWGYVLNGTTNAWDFFLWADSPAVMSLTAGPAWSQSYTGYVDANPHINFGEGFLMCDYGGSVGCERLFDAGSSAMTTGEQGNERFNLGATGGGTASWVLTPTFTTTLAGNVTQGVTTSVSVAACPSPSLPAGTQIVDTTSAANATQIGTLSTCSSTTLTFQAAASYAGTSGNTIKFLQARPAAPIANDTGGTSWTLGNNMALTPVAIGSLPSCVSGEAGTLAVVNNGIASPTYRQAVSATSTATQLVFCDGSGWTYH